MYCVHGDEASRWFIKNSLMAYTYSLHLVSTWLCTAHRREVSDATVSIVDAMEGLIRISCDTCNNEDTCGRKTRTIGNEAQHVVGIFSHDLLLSSVPRRWALLAVSPYQIGIMDTERVVSQSFLTPLHTPRIWDRASKFSSHIDYFRTKEPRFGYTKWKTWIRFLLWKGSEDRGMYINK